MRLTKKVMIMCALISLTGCATNKYTSSCLGWLPIYLDRQDLNTISPNLARDILKHNQHGKQLCGWKHVQKTK
uniref:Lipoprotein n=1 Tax=Bartonella schoenbuchensis (strain DSM 13525 / NCTC 13165 / R1) TaxID=687861 RepID=E6YZS6_BARSR|nr:hypothetical protein [Bartonella schoenbuchensis]CBI82364.1 conserved exported hypothetical protein [Bartonella schoenbuchensis R1]